MEQKHEEVVWDSSVVWDGFFQGSPCAEACRLGKELNSRVSKEWTCDGGPPLSLFG